METELIKNNEIDITEGVIWQKLLLFFFPIMLGTFFQQIYNTADTIIVGKFVGKVALAAVGGSTTQMVNLSVGFFVGLTSGASVIFAQFYGAKDKENLNKILHTAFSFGILCSAFLSVFGIYYAKKILILMNTPTDVIPDSLIYLKVYFFGIIFAITYNMGASILRASGDSKRPLYILIITCVINIVLDLIFVIVFKMGIFGVALGTIISQAISAFIIIMLLSSKQPLFQLKIKKIKIHFPSLKGILIIGVPIALESVMYCLSNLIIQVFVNNLGTDSVAAWGTFAKVDAIFWLINGAFGISVTTFVAQNYGAGKFMRMKKSIQVGFILCFAFGAVITTTIYIFREEIFWLFTNDKNVVEIGVKMMAFLLPWYLVFVIIEIFTSAFRGIGKVVVPTLLVGGGVCLLRVIWMYAYVKNHYTIYAIMLSYPISWILTSILFIVYYFTCFPRKLSKS